MITKFFTYILLIGSCISLILAGCNSTNQVPYQSEYMNINLTYSQELVKKNGDDDQLILTLNDVGMIDVYAYPRAAETFEYSLGNSLGESIDDNEVITILSALNEFQWMGEYPPSAIVEQPKRIMVNNFSGAIMTTYYQSANGTSQVYLMSAIMHDEMIITVAGWIPEDNLEQFRPIFEDVVYSIKPLAEIH